jgi:maltose O-acetyltransferase
VLHQVLTAADAHERAGRSDDAQLLYRQVLDIEPDNEHALHGLLATTAPSNPRRPLARRVTARLGRPLLLGVCERPRHLKYRALSTCRPTGGRPRILQPVLFLGLGEVRLGTEVQFGWPRSPLFHTGYSHIEATFSGSLIELGDRLELNNNAFIKSEGAGVRIGADGLFGANVEVFDSNFHDLDPHRRRTGSAAMAPVDVGVNVFVGMGVKILKGVTIGADSVIGAGAVVSSSIPAGVIAVGNPARVVREL